MTLKENIRYPKKLMQPENFQWNTTAKVQLNHTKLYNTYDSSVFCELPASYTAYSPTPDSITDSYKNNCSKISFLISK